MNRNFGKLFKILMWESYLNSEKFIVFGTSQSFYVGNLFKVEVCEKSNDFIKKCENFDTKLFHLLRWSFLTGFTVLEFHDSLSQIIIKIFTELHY